jgi:hypothetical protein
MLYLHLSPVFLHIDRTSINSQFALEKSRKNTVLFYGIPNREESLPCVRCPFALLRSPL